MKEKNKKTKNDNMNFEYINDSHFEGKDFDKEKIFEESYERIKEKYGFKENGQLLKNIFEKMQDDSIEGDEIDDLRFVYNYMNNIS